MSTSTFAPTLTAHLADPVAQWTQALAAFSKALRVAMPGVVVSFDPDAQTVIVRPAITENVINAGQLETRTLLNLEDVPICVPRGGGYSFTLPIAAGDECLVIFADMDIGAWWEAGAATQAQNQIHERRHVCADCFAILGTWSQPRVLANYSMSSAQMRNDAGTVLVDLAANQASVIAPTVRVTATSVANVQAPTVNVAGSTAVNITGGHCSIDGRNFLTHEHSGVATGAGVSGPVV
jgi:hypothetical protein